MDRIFTPFQRLHGRGEHEGTGMGPALRRGIAVRRGGTLVARGTPVQVSSFPATVPPFSRGEA